jgi:hypothetical protein
MKMIRKGEYDLVNISLIGHDPNTGRTYEQCQDEWNAERDRILIEWGSLPWWNFWRNIRLRWEVAALYSKLGY